LWQACTDGDFEVARKLADDPAVDVNWGDPEVGRTPFYRACFFGWTSVVEYLMRNPRVDVVKQQSQGTTPFLAACQGGHMEVILLLLADPRIDPHKPRDIGVTPFAIACECGHKEVVSLLLANPRIDPNKPRDAGATPFFAACQNGHKEVVLLLLADPRIDPNKPMNDEATPFLIACQKGHKEVVSLLLADPRIDPNKPWNDQSTPLWFASQNGHLVVVQHLLASDREIDTRMKSTFNNTAAEQGRAMGARTTKPADEMEEVFERSKTNSPRCADLIDEYERDPVATRNRLRRQPGLREYFIGYLFALVVFHSDSFAIINVQTAHPDTRRMFRITWQLPLDLQMVCNRIFGSPRDIILSRDSEPGFQLLARTTTWQ